MITPEAGIRCTWRIARLTVLGSLVYLISWSGSYERSKISFITQMAWENSQHLDLKKAVYFMFCCLLDSPILPLGGYISVDNIYAGLNFNHFIFPADSVLHKPFIVKVVINLVYLPKKIDILCEAIRGVIVYIWVPPVSTIGILEPFQKVPSGVIRWVC